MPERKPRTWICQRQAGGVKCRHVNPRRLQICVACGKRRPKTKEPEHRAVLKVLNYEACVILFGEKCGICGAGPKPGKKLLRDHEHEGAGIVRGLLCTKCNRFLVKQKYGLKITADWLEAAATYLRRSGASGQ